MTVPHRYSEVWYVKRTTDSQPEKVTLFFESELFASVAHSKAKKANDARLFFGNDFPKEIASCWQ
jgi:hypothetical protein